MNKPSFRVERPTGRFRSFFPSTHTIKVGRKGEVGSIAEDRTGKWRVDLMVQQVSTPQSPAPFKWIRLKGQFTTAEEARAFVQSKWEVIAAKFELHVMEDV